MTKQEKIQEEYLKLGLPFNENIVFDNGWLKIKPGLCSSKYDVLDLLKLTSNVHSVRPKSLHGIENNNGWIKIQSEDDLPKEDCDVWCMMGISITHKIYQTNMKKWWLEYMEYYQPIIKPQPPLY